MRTTFRAVAGALAVAILAQGCALTQLVDRYFIGSTEPAVMENRKMTGYFLIPFALALDVVTVPLQIILLVALGDDFLYSKAAGKKTFASYEVFSREPAVARLTEAQRQQLWKLMHEALQSPLEARELTFGVTAEGTLVRLDLPAEQKQQVVARAHALSSERLTGL